MAPQSLARRLLFPHSTALPPLLATPDVPHDLHAELWDLIALALRAYVHPWWTRITRYDKDLLPHTAQLLTVVVRALESRTLALDLPSLVFCDVPNIITQHYRDFRCAESKLTAGGVASLPLFFHHLQPHIALSPDGTLDWEYYRQIVDHVLRVCLPAEDYAPDAERAIVREALVKVLVDHLIPKVARPWFIQSIILDLLAQPNLYQSPKSSAKAPVNSFSFHTFIVIVLSALQSFSSTCLALIHAYKQAMSTIKRVNHTPHPITPLPLPQIHHQTQRPASPTPKIFYHENYASPLLTLFSEVFLTSERLAATTIMTFFAMISVSIQPFLDKLLPHLLYSSLSPAFILDMVRLGKRNIFPNGYPGLPSNDPTPEEQAAIRQRLAEWRATGNFSRFIPFLLGANPGRTINVAIDPLTCQPCNTRLIVILFDRILLGLFPELIGENIATDSPVTTTNASSSMILHACGSRRDVDAKSPRGGKRSSASSPGPGVGSGGV